MEGLLNVRFSIFHGVFGHAQGFPVGLGHFIQLYLVIMPYCRQTVLMAVNKELPSGFKKIDSFLRDISRKKTFIKDVARLRKQFGVPKKGYEYAPKKMSGKLLYRDNFTDAEKKYFLAALDILAQ